MKGSVPIQGELDFDDTGLTFKDEQKQPEPRRMLWSPKIA
jgi:hypothetical protein